VTGHGGTHLSFQLCGKLSRRIPVQASLDINVRPYLKITKVKRAQVVEHLPSKRKALNSNPTTIKKKKKKPHKIRKGKKPHPLFYYHCTQKYFLISSTYTHIF
jgi:hypothetical protein